MKGATSEAISINAYLVSSEVETVAPRLSPEADSLREAFFSPGDSPLSHFPFRSHDRSHTVCAAGHLRRRRRHWPLSLSFTLPPSPGTGKMDGWRTTEGKWAALPGPRTESTN